MERVDVWAGTDPGSSGFRAISGSVPPGMSGVRKTTRVFGNRARLPGKNRRPSRTTP